MLFYFHLDADELTETGARHPRDRLDWPKVGIFAQRGRMRLNRIGLSARRVTGNAPKGPFREPAWAKEIMSNYG